MTVLFIISVPIPIKSPIPESIGTINCQRSDELVVTLPLCVNIYFRKQGSMYILIQLYKFNINKMRKYIRSRDTLTIGIIIVIRSCLLLVCNVSSWTYTCGIHCEPFWKLS